MQSREKHPKSVQKIRFQDCDPYNHLNNARYADYFINAREDHLEEHYGLVLAEHVQKTQKGWLAISSQTSFYKPVNNQEKVVIKSELIHFDARSINVEMTMWNNLESQLKALHWIRFMYYDFVTMKVAQHDMDLMELFADVLVSNSHTSFEVRNSEILQAAKIKNT